MVNHPNRGRRGYRDTYSISIQYQGHEVTDDDVWRAKCAALDCLEKAGVAPAAACEAYGAQWARLDNEDDMSGDEQPDAAQPGQRAWRHHTRYRRSWAA